VTSGSNRSTSRLRIIVLGYIVRFPLGGMAWHYLQYAIGLARLGHDVYFLEDSEDFASCYDPARHVTDTDPTYGMEFTAAMLDRVGLKDRWAFYDAHQQHWLGPRAHEIDEIIANAELLLNISGANPLRGRLVEVPVRVFIDTDPLFEQVRQLTVPDRRERALQHNSFFSFGENIASGKCSVPDDGLPWRPTRQPIVLGEWPVASPRPTGLFTTVMQWDSYAPREYRGTRYGLKSMSFQPYLDLPEKVGPIFELALGTPHAPRDLLRRKGWKLTNPLEITRDCRSYQRYIQHSKAEFSVAKHGYVATRSGWFSERSACYLASGRPVVAQDTGFSEVLNTDAGLLPFNTPDEAIGNLQEIKANYRHHCRQARIVAEEYFDSRTVLRRLIDLSMNPT